MAASTKSQNYTPNDNWRHVPFAPSYIISRDGTVISLKGHTLRILTPWLNTSGYEQVDLDRKAYCVHVVVARTFLDAPPDAVCRFLNNDRSDIRADNICWKLRSSGASTSSVN